MIQGLVSSQKVETVKSMEAVFLAVFEFLLFVSHRRISLLSNQSFAFLYTPQQHLQRIYHCSYAMYERFICAIRRGRILGIALQVSRLKMTRSLTVRYD